VWRNVIAAFPHTVIESFVRALKDMLADTNDYGKLRYIVEQRKAASFALHAAFLDGLRRLLFPELVEAFREFKETGSWESVERARLRGYGAARERAQLIMEIFRSGKQKKDMAWAAKEIEKTVLGPLGLLKWKSEE
jgi:hypothetical protein